jgi:hypothetical protein
LYEPSPATLTFLERAAKVAQRAERYAERATRDVKLVSFGSMSDEKKLAWLKRRLADGSLSKEILETVLREFNRYVFGPMLDYFSLGKAAEVFVEDWKHVIERKTDYEVYITDLFLSKLIQWKCRECREHAPWEGALCLNCGHVRRIRKRLGR